MEGVTIGTYFSAEGFSLEHAKQSCSDMIKAMAKSRNVILVGDLIFSPPHYEDQTVLIYTYSDALPTAHDPFCYMDNCDCTIEERYEGHRAGCMAWDCDCELITKVRQDEQRKILNKTNEI